MFRLGLDYGLTFGIDFELGLSTTHAALVCKPPHQTADGCKYLLCTTVPIFVSPYSSCLNR